MAPVYRVCYAYPVPRLSIRRQLGGPVRLPKIDYSTLERRVAAMRDAAAASMPLRDFGDAVALTGRTRGAVPSLQRLPGDFWPLRRVAVDPVWSSLPGWPGRCPGAGRLSRAWATVNLALPVRMDELRCLLRHSALRGEARAAIEAAIEAYMDEQQLLAIADGLAGGGDCLYVGLDLAKAL